MSSSVGQRCDVVLVDGNGLLHADRFGYASHLGVLINLPTIGVAKKYYYVEGLPTREEVMQRAAREFAEGTEELHSGFECSSRDI